MKKLYIIGLLLAAHHYYAQTEIDGLMMGKNNFCVGAIYDYNSWDKYWEGTFKRENLNFGTISTQRITVNANYGITKKLNFIFSLPYVITSASAGTMRGQEGLQDLSLTLKYSFYEKSFQNSSLSFYAIGGFSFPSSNYVADYLPLSIGLQSKIGTLRIMSDYQFGNLFATASGAYLKRSNIKIDRNAYYTTEMHYTNEVAIPDVISVNLRTGYRTQRLIAEVIFDIWTTQQGGFDITTNNMPFPSNTMNSSKLGANFKYNLKTVTGLSLIFGVNHVIDGRNVGQSNSVYGGIFYLMDFKSNKIKNNEK